MSLKLRNLSVRSRFHLVMALVTLSLVVLAAWSAIAAHADLPTPLPNPQTSAEMEGGRDQAATSSSRA